MHSWYVDFGFPHSFCIVVLSYALGGTRTPNPLSRNQLRYPITPQEQVHQARVELATFRVSDECSNQLSYWCIYHTSKCCNSGNTLLKSSSRILSRSRILNRTVSAMELQLCSALANAINSGILF